MKYRVFNVLRAALLGVALAGPAAAADLTVFAAASLRGALEDVADAWEQTTGGALTLVFAGSSAVARQVQAGAPADLVILANSDWMDMLQASGDIRPDARVDLLSNRLVLIGGWHDTEPLDLTDRDAVLDRLGDDRIALALIDAVPAGIYARAALDSLGLWDAVSPQVVQTDNVRTALALVATRAANFGIVYATDALVEPGVALIAEFSPDLHPPIRYPAAVVSHGDTLRAAQLLAFLQSPIAQAIFAGHGFGLTGGG
jgi:molybdate transport system substrate-binding protein